MFEWAKTVHALDRAATVIGLIFYTNKKYGAFVRQRTTPTERRRLIGEVSANFSG
jgi:hypothetical protein